MASIFKSVANAVPRRYLTSMTDHQKKLYPQVKQTITDEGYPLLKFAPTKRNIFAERKRRARRERIQLPPRETSMGTDIDWPSVWPTAKTFVPSAVPLPIRQSYEERRSRVPRAKHANTELLKIANFLHLTPPAVERHCRALRKFCTKWPEGLDTDAQVRDHFPVTRVTRDYVHAMPTIRDQRARVVDLQVHIDDLHLNERDKDKLIQLAGHRYDAKTGTLTITTEQCPSKVQNLDYADYLLTALYFESKNHEPWEDERPEQVDIRPDLDEYRAKVERQLGLS